VATGYSQPSNSLMDSENNLYHKDQGVSADSMNGQDDSKRNTKRIGNSALNKYARDKKMGKFQARQSDDSNFLKNLNQAQRQKHLRSHNDMDRLKNHLGFNKNNARVRQNSNDVKFKNMENDLNKENLQHLSKSGKRKGHHSHDGAKSFASHNENTDNSDYDQIPRKAGGREKEWQKHNFGNQYDDSDDDTEESNKVDLDNQSRLNGRKHGTQYENRLRNNALDKNKMNFEKNVERMKRRKGQNMSLNDYKNQEKLLKNKAKRNSIRKMNLSQREVALKKKRAYKSAMQQAKQKSNTSFGRGAHLRKTIGRDVSHDKE